ncbi:Type 1 phosphatases regulator [Fulvia fulva]|uniref:Type 1 phosphatases regulator n=1 Tax=Passalora fulva TaxID=5499 RepID=A0A9Q8PLC2_PASFU|nr:Type 1 phosphatases regulator [Fulvia fulva]KAK4610601.1 Type 1 phosphatases regulator [Fulvia fulva]KAK4611095.1 Type 1 phosphatases regulator [Fulvia fulva]UJO24545.1 Type 1 phosphatases regulator [Fulvia fulva]WPV22051.1 Type 1 phosphatases regulator [Fulvia fulva]WPV37037.1 Type 1 phosphatases regulator [Fulvia fulva]
MANPPHRQVRTAAGPGAASPASGSQTTLQTDSTPSATLRLRGASAEPSQPRRVVWAEDVIDNEGMGKKSSKVCCIYHKPHEPGDSDSEDSSSSDSGSDSEPDLSRAQKAGGKGRGRKHEHGDGGEHGKGKEKGNQRKPSPNAYERQPKYKGKKES